MSQDNIDTNVTIGNSYQPSNTAMNVMKTILQIQTEKHDEDRTILIKTNEIVDKLNYMDRNLVAQVLAKLKTYSYVESSPLFSRDRKEGEKVGYRLRGMGLMVVLKK